MKKPHVFKGVFIGLFFSSFLWVGIYKSVNYVIDNYQIIKIEKDNSNKEFANLD